MRTARHLLASVLILSLVEVEINCVVLKDTIDGGPILIDKQTMAIMANHEIQWLTEQGTMMNKEPTILAVELTQEN